MKLRRKPDMMSEQLREVHPFIPSMYDKLKQGRVSRREFMRMATLLGASVGLATAAAACGAQPETGGDTAAPAEEEAAGGEEAAPAEEAAAGGIVRGGSLTVAAQVPAADHPARYSWIFDSNQTRLVYEYLTETDAENITTPYLLESWEPNDDLTVWTLNLREGITFHDGSPFNAEVVEFNLGQWLNPDIGSSILGLWEGFLTMDGVEVVDDMTVRLNLSAPLLAVPENLFHYPAQIMPVGFTGDITTGDVPGTGPYTLVEHSVGERVRIERQDNYWRMGEDGEPLPYLDAVEWIDLGEDQTAWVSALLSGQVGHMYEPSADTFLAVRDNENISVKAVPSGNGRVFRFRVDQEPWTIPETRNAVKMIQDRQKILDQAYFGEGVLGHDVHVVPVQPEFAPMDVPPYDPEGAAELLASVGQEGLTFDVSVGTGWTDIVAMVEIMQEDARAADINMSLATMPNASYWDLWTETAVGVTPWTHRPLAVMLLPLAYIADSEGNPVPWNETRWVDEEFSTLLREAQGTLDIEARREIMADIQRIMQERGPVAIPYWRNVWAIHNPAYQNVTSHPTNYNLWHEVWYDAEQDPFA